MSKFGVYVSLAEANLYAKFHRKAQSWPVHSRGTRNIGLITPSQVKQGPIRGVGYSYPGEG